MINDIIEVFDSIEKTNTGGNNIQPTLLYNEGWMLRLVLIWFSKNADIDYIISIKKEAHWFSEALLSSKFLPIFRGDNLSESYTRADGVYGDIIIGDNRLGNLFLKNNCRQFFVLEAKMVSKLSKSIKNASNYNQAARNIACMCNIITNSKQDIKNLGFFVIAPEEQIKSEQTFLEYTNIEHIKQTVLNRINQYNTRSDYDDKFEWYNIHFLPFCDLVKINLLSWEEIIKYIITVDKNYGMKINDFFEKCLFYNKHIKNQC